MKFMLAFTLCALSVQGKVLDRTYFTWTGSVDRNSDAIPDLEVRFADGTTDKIALSRYHAYEFSADSKDPCSFLGHLVSDPESVVSVTGCPHDREFEVMILSKTHPTLRMSVNPAHGIGETIETVHHNRRDYRLPAGVTFAEAKKLATTRGSIPATMTMTLVTGIDASFLAKLGSAADVTTYMNQAMTHVQAYYLDPSLGTKITFKTPIPNENMADFTCEADSASLNTLLSRTPGVLSKTGGHAFAVMCHDTSPDSTIGLAWTGIICFPSQYDGYKTSTNEWHSSITIAAETIAHEVGHNFGMLHDESGCSNGIMHPSDTGFTTWSECSKAYIEGQYTKITGYGLPWCIPA